MPGMPEHNLAGDEPAPRPEVIQAVLSALTDMDPAKLAPLQETGITAAEREQAEELFLTTMLATADHRSRRVEASGSPDSARMASAPDMARNV